MILSRLNPWELNTLRSVPQLADPAGVKELEARLYPPPAVAGDIDARMAEDWAEFVVPELRDRFRSAIGIMAADVAAAAPDVPRRLTGRSGSERPDEEPGGKPPLARLTIPPDHVESWYLAMNQARLIMVERFDIRHESPPPLEELLATGRLEPWLQYELLCGLQFWLLQNVIDSGGG